MRKDSADIAKELFQKFIDYGLIPKSTEQHPVGWANQYQDGWGFLYELKEQAAHVVNKRALIEKAIPLYRVPQPEPETITIEAHNAAKNELAKTYENTIANLKNMESLGNVGSSIGFLLNNFIGYEMADNLRSITHTREIDGNLYEVVVREKSFTKHRLNPCENCGEKATMSFINDHQYRVRCDRCGSFIFMSARSNNDVIAAWNVANPVAGVVK